MASGVEPSFKAASAKNGAEGMGGGARKGVDSTKLFTTNASSLTMARLTPGTSATVEKGNAAAEAVSTAVELEVLIEKSVGFGAAQPLWTCEW